MKEKISGKYPYCAPTIQKRALVNNVPFALPNALIEMRTGNASANRPSTTSPHVYIYMENRSNNFDFSTYDSNCIRTK